MLAQCCMLGCDIIQSAISEYPAISTTRVHEISCILYTSTRLHGTFHETLIATVTVVTITNFTLHFCPRN